MGQEEDIWFVAIAKIHLQFFLNPTIETPRALRPRGLRLIFCADYFLACSVNNSTRIGAIRFSNKLGFIRLLLRVQDARGSAESSRSRFPRTRPDGEIALQPRVAFCCGGSRLCLSNPSTAHR